MEAPDVETQGDQHASEQLQGQSGPASAEQAVTPSGEDLRVDDLLEDVSIDGMCGVY